MGDIRGLVDITTGAGVINADARYGTVGSVSTGYVPRYNADTTGFVNSNINENTVDTTVTAIFFAYSPGPYEHKIRSLNFPTNGIKGLLGINAGYAISGSPPSNGFGPGISLYQTSTVGGTNIMGQISAVTNGDATTGKLQLASSKGGTSTVEIVISDQRVDILHDATVEGNLRMPGLATFAIMTTDADSRLSTTANVVIPQETFVSRNGALLFKDWTNFSVPIIVGADPPFYIAAGGSIQDGGDGWVGVGCAPVNNVKLKVQGDMSSTGNIGIDGTALIVGDADIIGRMRINKKADTTTGEVVIGYGHAPFGSGGNKLYIGQGLIENYAESGGQWTTLAIKGNAVNIYHNNTSVFNTVSGGVNAPLDLSVTGNIYSVNWTDWASSVDCTGWNPSSLSLSYYYKRVGKTLHVKLQIQGTSTNDFARISVPYALYAPNTNNFDILKPCMVTNASIGKSSPGLLCYFDTTTLQAWPDWTSSSWTASGTKMINADFSVELA